MSFDENALKQAEQAQKQAELVQKYAAYEANFVKTFGTIANGHQWGFDQTAVTATRGSVTDSDEKWIIPDDFTNPNPNKEGIYANCARAAAAGTLLADIPNFDFSNYFLQHVEQPKNKNGKKKVGQLQAWDSHANGGQGDWVDCDNFSDGKNNGFFDCLGINSYISQDALHCTTLMTNMGTAKDANNKRFRVGSDSDGWSYNYGFLAYDNSYFLCVEHINFKGELGWWIIRIGEANPDRINNTKYQARVLCEDMGDIGDYDFNDVVFDAIIDKNNNIDIEIVAAGGILPIYIGGEDEEHGGTRVTIGRMANTGEGEFVPYQKIHYPANDDGSPKFASINDIPVYVNPGGSAIPYELVARPSAAPQKICTFLKTKYADEYVRIDNAYKQFAEWVNNAQPTTWSRNMNWWLTDLDLTNNNAAPTIPSGDE